MAVPLRAAAGTSCSCDIRGDVVLAAAAAADAADAAAAASAVAAAAGFLATGTGCAARVAAPAGFLAKGTGCAAGRAATAAAGLFLVAAPVDVGGEPFASETRDLNCSFFFGLRSSLVHLPCAYSSAKALMMSRPAFVAAALVA
jgi:hypothetical protein